MAKSLTKSATPSTQPPAVSLRGGAPRKESELRQSHELMRQLLVRLNATIDVHGNDPILNKKLAVDYLPEIVAAIDRAKWVTG